MRAAGVGEAAIAAFGQLLHRLRAGDEGLIREREIEPVGELPEVDDLETDDDSQSAALARTAIIKLNGGLGTSMGLAQAKSLLVVKEGLTFLDIVARQTLGQRRRSGARLPLVLMNSFHTRADSLAALDRYPDLAADVPADMVQSREPKLRVDDLQPVGWPPDPELEWCPPGHGDLYPTLIGSGMLETLLDRGYEYAFVSNVDNLGAVVSPRILGWMDSEGIPFVTEQCRRTEADRKGGHLARARDDGRLVLRETAQTAAEDQDAMQDLTRHPYFNVNNLAINLRALADLMAARENVLPLPLIRNRKTVDPSDPDSAAVYQLETAMGAAVSQFEGARAVCVPRARFVPVKTTDDLLGVRSDCYELTQEYELSVSPRRRRGPLFVSLDPGFYKRLGDFEARFPQGPPSLVGCERLVVRGDVCFGAGVVARGEVELVNADTSQMQVADGTVLGATGSQ